MNDGGIYAPAIILGNHQLTGDEPLKARGKDLEQISHQYGDYQRYFTVNY